MYFEYLCYFWAAVGIISRIIIGVLGEKWNKWEIDSAYSEKKPKWIYLMALADILLILFTWYMVVKTDIRHSWIIAILMSLTSVKIFTLLFNYKKFRSFASAMLNSKKKFFQLNLSVVLFSMTLILMGIYIY
ncbi:MAG: hypothetical protein JEZ04_09645 [Spirochaetales bacterium]|nr:hypothetical protein [Spirochaetales bacterium]